jgi:NAD-dependent dihydropyrimidine dehydrogenase PreA subunit
MDDLYEKLRQRLDDLATGFPSTDNRIEIRILKRLFNEEEARFFLQLSPQPETPEKVAQRLNRDPEEVATLLEAMAAKGMIFRLRKEDANRYCAVPYIVGIYEFQVQRMDPEMAYDMDEYFEKALGRTLQSFKTPVMRTIPINRDIAVKWPIAPYEDALAIFENQAPIALVPCVCRTHMNLCDKGCDKPIEACFMFGSHARYYVDNGMGRYIDKEEAREIVKRNEKEGLVMQPFNSQKVGGMCSCCGDCCGMLRSLKKQPNPASAVQSNYFAEIDPEECIGCEICLERCQMESIRMIDERAVIDPARCIGCGLCVTTCSGEALRLVKKSDHQLYVPPKSGAETYGLIATERGK